MKRTAKILRKSNDGKIFFCVDVESFDTINEYIERNNQHIKKFNYIVNVILNRLRVTDVYDKEDFNDKSKGVTAMKFFKGRSNDRIYCKEQTMEDKTFIVVGAELYEKKKSKKLDNKAKQIIEKVASYEYEIIE